MRYTTWMGCLVVIFAVGVNGQGTSQKNDEIDARAEHDRKQVCSPNSDTLYNRPVILRQLANILERSIPEFFEFDRGGFQVKEEKGKNFFVYDLVDTTNKQTSTQCVQLADKHVYHFAPIHLPYSFSHIVVLEGGNLKVFRSINCKGRGDTLENVIAYVKTRLADQLDTNEVIGRIKDYRKYGFYFTVDDDVIRCTVIGPATN